MRSLLVASLVLSWLVLLGCGDMADEEGVPNVRRVGPEGATLTLGAATVEIPAGALTKAVEVSLVEATGVPEGALEIAYALHPADLAFAVPATVRLTFTAASLPPGVPESSLLAGTPDDGSWTLLPRSSVNTHAAQVTGTVDRALIFGLVSSRCYHPNACPVAKLDLLLVVDNSSSMCQEQNRLADELQRFVGELQERPNLDLRVAVTTTDVRTDGRKGRFMNVPAAEYGPACHYQEVAPCQEDEECEQRFPGAEGSWECSWSDKQRVLTQNDNGSLNSSCAYACTTDADCIAHAGSGYACTDQTAGLGPVCMPVPPSDTCPVDLPTVLDSSNVDLLRCLVLVGADGAPKVNLEGGLKAGWLALQPEAEGVTDVCAATNPNVCELRSPEVVLRLQTLDAEIAGLAPGSEQDELIACRERLSACRSPVVATEPDFLRPDAWLTVVFISDEDDCSDRDDNPFDLNETKLCAYDTEKLLPIDDLVAKYRTVKPEPSRLLVAAVAGDVQLRGASSCLVPDFCSSILEKPTCSCYAGGVKAPTCPKLLREEDDLATCTAECATAPDWEARRTRWCLADPPTDWCSPEAEPAPTGYCLLLDARIAAYDRQLASISPLQDADPATLSPDALACVAKVTTFGAERAALAAAREACDERLAEELAYRRACLDDCYGKGEGNPQRRCSLLVPEACGCYAPDGFEKSLCLDLLQDEPAYRTACLRACFDEAKQTSAVQPNTAPSVCQSADGIADLGTRYLAFVDAFGADGRRLNICSADRLGDELVRLGTTIRRRIEGE